MVNVTDTVSAILSEWRKQAGYLIGAAVILELVATVAGMLMLRQLRSQRMLNEAHAGAKAELLVAHERERADREKLTQNVRFGAALSNMSQALCMFDSDDHLVIANNRLAQIFGMPNGTIVPGMSIGRLGLAAKRANMNAKDRSAICSGMVALRQAGVRATRTHALLDGRTLSVNYAPVADGGWLMTLEDISEQQATKARIMHMAHHDA